MKKLETKNVLIYGKKTVNNWQFVSLDMIWIVNENIESVLPQINGKDWKIWRKTVFYGWW